jgi:hypothetical protein
MADILRPLLRANGDIGASPDMKKSPGLPVRGALVYASSSAPMKKVDLHLRKRFH